MLFSTLAATALYGISGAVAVPIDARICAAWRYLRETLVFERWGKFPVREISAGGPVPTEARRTVSVGEACGYLPEAGEAR